MLYELKIIKVMKKINKVLVGLELDSFDEKLLEGSKEIVNTLIPKEISFVNVYEPIEVSAPVLKKFPNILSLKEIVQHQCVSQLIKEADYLNLEDTKRRFYAVEGTPLTKILNLINQNKIDLLIMGKKFDVEEHQISQQKMIRKANCDVLLVLEEKKQSLSNIFVPIDFSENSKKALLRAIKIAKRAKSKITAHHTFEVPIGYSKTGKSFEEFSTIMEINAQKEMEAFLSDVENNEVISRSFSLTPNGDIVGDIIANANALKADLIMIGAKGRTDLSSIFLGSVAEGVADKTSQASVWICKTGKEPMDFIDLLTK